MWKTSEGSTGRLIQLCIGYFITYVITGVTVKYFTSLAGLRDVEFLAYSTFGGSLICLVVVIAFGWYRWSEAPRKALWYIIPSGVCTAVVIPTTTMMYMLPISVMVAMVIMRASLIVIGRAVDAIQIRQGLLHKKVYQEENTAVLFALTAAGMQLFFVKPGDFDFIHSTAAMSILGCYLTAYAIRIYIMNYYKNTRPKGTQLNNKWFFSIEQIAASFAMIGIILFIFSSPSLFGLIRPVYDVTIPEQLKAANTDPIAQLYFFMEAITSPKSQWFSAAIAGTFFGGAAFFSVFIFMFKGRTATFANLVNRLTSLVAGTASTILYAWMYGGKYPKSADWISLMYILIAVGYLTIAEHRRVAELQVEHEIAGNGVAKK